MSGWLRLVSPVMAMVATLPSRGTLLGQQRLQAVDSAAVRRLAARALVDWQVPGIAIGVIANGRVVVATGVGYRDLKRNLPVGPGTLFGIGSNTKSFTALLLGTLVDEGRLEWSEPVRRYLPDFELWDPVAPGSRRCATCSII